MPESKPIEKWVGYKVGLILVLLGTLVFLLLPNGRHMSEPRAAQYRRHVPYERLYNQASIDRIRLDIAEGKFDYRDLQYSHFLAKSSDPKNQTTGIGLLIEAVHKRLLPKEDAVVILERRIQYNSGVPALIPLAEFRALLNMPAQEMGKFDKSMYAPKKGTGSSLSAQEKTFLSSTLRNAKLSVRSVAGDLIASKMNLSSVDKEWALQQISTQMSNTDLVEHTYWKFVQKMVRAKS